MQITDKDFPYLYVQADQKAINSQKEYFREIKISLFSIIIASLVSFITQFVNYSIFRYLALFLFLINFAVLAYAKIKKPDELWYESRSIAESIKTLAWRYLTKAHPFNVEDKMADNIFKKHLSHIKYQNESTIKKFTPIIDILNRETITGKMKEMRGFSLANRLELYHNERINDQENWYIKKTTSNKKISRIFFIISMLLNISIIILLIINIQHPKLVFPIAFIAVLCTSLATWVQSKKYDELSYSYSLASNDICLIKKDSSSINDEKAFSEYVLDCENAFSREHTQWYARKYL